MRLHLLNKRIGKCTQNISGDNLTVQYTIVVFRDFGVPHRPVEIPFRGRKDCQKPLIIILRTFIDKIQHQLFMDGRQRKHKLHLSRLKTLTGILPESDFLKDGHNAADVFLDRNLVQYIPISLTDYCLRNDSHQPFTLRRHAFKFFLLPGFNIFIVFVVGLQFALYAFMLRISGQRIEETQVPKFCGTLRQ